MIEDNTGITLVTLGGLLLLGLTAQTIGARTNVPRVTVLILLGIVIGPVGVDLLPDLSNQWFRYITTVALTMIGFLLGGKLNPETMRTYGLTSVILSLLITLATFVVVFSGLSLIGVSTPIALILAGISLATDPIATLDVVENSTANSRLKNFLPGIVALDDVWGLILFSIIMTVVQLMGHQTFGSSFLIDAMRELLGSVMLGAVLGIPMALLTGRLKEGEPTMIEALGMVMLCAGLSEIFQVSYLLAAIAMGVTIGLVARHHKYSFHEIEHIEWPFLMLFLILVGASFRPDNLMVFSSLGLGYVVFRIIGRIIGCHLLFKTSFLNVREKTFLGLSLLPQAGVALGAAIYANEHFPESTHQVITVTIGATIVFELLGPIVAAWSLRQTDATSMK